MIGNKAVERAMVDGGIESAFNRVMTSNGLASKGTNQNSETQRPVNPTIRTTPTYFHALTSLILLAKNCLS
jgi:hypothetical protein